MATTLAEGAPHTPARPAVAGTMRLDTVAQPRLGPVTAASAPQAVMSPVNQNGCFEFDRIIKAGTVVKRTRKTKVRRLPLCPAPLQCWACLLTRAQSWRPVYVVLRPNCLSIYKDKDETKLRHQISLSEITAVARQRDSKKKMDHVFGVFPPATTTSAPPPTGRLRPG